MEQQDIEEILIVAARVTRQAARLYRALTGKNIDVDGIVRHYPLITLSLAAGAGVLGGYLLGRRSGPQLPPPGTAELPNPIEYVERLLPESAEKVRDMLPEGMERVRSLLPEGVERVRARFPESVERVREALPEGVERVRDMLPAVNEMLPAVHAEEAAESARTWVDEVLEPKLKEGVDTVVANVAETRLGSFLRQSMQRLEAAKDTELEDPEE